MLVDCVLCVCEIVEGWRLFSGSGRAIFAGSEPAEQFCDLVVEFLIAFEIEAFLELSDFALEDLSLQGGVSHIFLYYFYSNFSTFRAFRPVDKLGA